VNRPAVNRLRRKQLGAIPLLARHVIRSMPWVTIITGCVAGIAFLALLAHVADTSHRPLDQGTVRIAFLPAVAVLAFLLRAPFRPLTQATPVPAWVTPTGHLLLAAPVLVATGWAQLRIMIHTIPSHIIPSHTVPPHTLGDPPAVYPLIAQLAGWCAVAIAVAACVDRSRYSDLGGAVAAPVSFAAIALAWYLPASATVLVDPPATAHGVTVAWYLVATAALPLTWAAMRDRWHRYFLFIVITLRGGRTPGTGRQIEARCRTTR
jgi:hypothetical protein